jgi:hypothetical protein
MSAALSLLLAFPLAAAPARMVFLPVAERPSTPKKGPASETELAAQALRIQMRDLNVRLAEMRELYVAKTLAIVGPVVRDTGPAARAAAAEAERLTALHRRDSAPLILRLTVNALRLEEYKKTGVLPDSVPAEKELLAAIEGDWTPRRAEVELPDGDLRRLKKQLERWDIRPARRAPEALAQAPARASARPPSALPPAVAQRDAGRGRAAADPHPALLAQLGSPEPRERALAAEQLGGLGATGAPAVAPLRALLKDADGRVRGSAALALGGVGSAAEPGLLEELRALSADRDPEVRLSSKVALSRLENR